MHIASFIATESSCSYSYALNHFQSVPVIKSKAIIKLSIIVLAIPITLPIMHLLFSKINCDWFNAHVTAKSYYWLAIWFLTAS